MPSSALSVTITVDVRQAAPLVDADDTVNRRPERGKNRITLPEHAFGVSALAVVGEGDHCAASARTSIGADQCSTVNIDPSRRTNQSSARRMVVPVVRGSNMGHSSPGKGGSVGTLVVDRLVARFAVQLCRAGITRCRHRRGVCEPDQPIVVDHPDRLGGAVQDRGHEQFAASCRILVVSGRRCPPIRGPGLLLLKTGSHTRVRLHGALGLPASFEPPLPSLDHSE